MSLASSSSAAPDASASDALQLSQPSSASASAAPASDAPSLATVRLKLPPYWPSDPQLWFVQAEAQFANNNITSPKGRYNVVVASLAPEFAAEIRDLLISPPEHDPYNKLKSTLIQRTQKSEQARLRELLSTADVGDRQPSRVLRRMHQLLAGKTLDASLLREMFIQRLPPTVRMILSGTPATLSIEDLAALADKVVESTEASGCVNAVTETSTPSAVAASTENTDISRLRKDLERLASAVNALTSDGSSRARGRIHDRAPRSRGQSRSRLPSSTRTDNRCWYHRTFSDKARKCNCDVTSPSGNGPASR